MTESPCIIIERLNNPHHINVFYSGVVFLKKPFLICKAGDTLSKRQVNLLELLGEKLSVYQLKLKAVWTKGGGLEVLDNEDDSD